MNVREDKSESTSGNLFMTMRAVADQEQWPRDSMNSDIEGLN